MAPAGRGAAHRPPVPDAGARGGGAPRQARRRFPHDDQTGGMFNPLVRELNETLYQLSAVHLGRVEVRAAFGPFVPTPHHEAVRRTVDWFRKQVTATGRSPIHRRSCRPATGAVRVMSCRPGLGTNYRTPHRLWRLFVAIRICPLAADAVGRSGRYRTACRNVVQPAFYDWCWGSRWVPYADAWRFATRSLANGEWLLPMRRSRALDGVTP